MVMKEFNKKLELERIEVPELNYGEILVRLTASGVCGSDVHMHKGKDPRIPLPIILGHEGVGEVIDYKGNIISVNKNQINIGDHIIWNRGVTCGKCYYCKVLQNPAFCKNRWVYGIHKGCREKPYLNGCYSEYILLDKKTDIIKIPKDIDPEILVPASCSGATAAHCFEYVDKSFGDIVLIQGPGPLGIFCAYFASQSGASEIIMIGGTQKRLETAKEFGVTKIINRHQYNLKERKDIIMDITNNRGVDYAIEAVGKPEVVKEGIKLVRIDGSYISVGFGTPNGIVDFDFFQDLIRKNISLQGVWVSNMKHTYQAVKKIIQSPKLFSKLITHKYQLSEVNEALKMMENKSAVKAVLID